MKKHKFETIIISHEYLWIKINSSKWWVETNPPISSNQQGLRQKTRGYTLW